MVRCRAAQIPKFHFHSVCGPYSLLTPPNWLHGWEIAGGASFPEMHITPMQSSACTHPALSQHFWHWLRASPASFSPKSVLFFWCSPWLAFSYSGDPYWRWPDGQITTVLLAVATSWVISFYGSYTEEVNQTLGEYGARASLGTHSIASTCLAVTFSLASVCLAVLLTKI